MVVFFPSVENLTEGQNGHNGKTVSPCLASGMFLASSCNRRETRLFLQERSGLRQVDPKREKTGGLADLGNVVSPLDRTSPENDSDLLFGEYPQGRDESGRGLE
jgi:hypothetical protein